jgi:hypothetical protein
MFEPFDRLLLGLISGVVFGFLLQKGRVAKFHVIVGQFLLKDWTVLKVMGTAIVVGSVGVHLLVSLGMANLHVKPLLPGGVLLGAVLFGTGMAILGYCPGTGVAACGEGRRDAMVGLLGMVAGAGAYVLLYRWVLPVIGIWGDRGAVRLSDIAGVPPWGWIAGLAAILLILSAVSHSLGTTNME